MNKSEGGKEAILVHKHLKEETNLNVHVEQTNYTPEPQTAVCGTISSHN